MALPQSGFVTLRLLCSLVDGSVRRSWLQIYDARRTEDIERSIMDFRCITIDVGRYSVYGLHICGFRCQEILHTKPSNPFY